MLFIQEVARWYYSAMVALKDFGVERVFHSSPLHYLPFIARSSALLNKPSLAKAGFAKTHLRSMSHRQDVARGFGAYTHLTLEISPPILKAKLSAGFPHIRIEVPEASLSSQEFSLCRFNVAMTRYLRRNGQGGFEESDTNGRYYDGHQIPIARTDSDQTAMLRRYLGTDTMIEVLVHGDLALPKGTEIKCFSDQDAETAKNILDHVGSAWGISTAKAPDQYPEHLEYRAATKQFIQSALSDPNWKGDGLEFDRV